MPQNATEDLRTRAWEMYLSGVTRSRIAVALSLDRETVTRYIRACYAEVAGERRMTMARKLDRAIAVWRRIQEQAWDDHDADDERERRALAHLLAQAWAQTDAQQRLDGEGSKGSTRKNVRRSGVSMRYHSQRSQYLRVILDAEQAIARLEGLYEGAPTGGEAVTFTVSKWAEG